MIAAELLAEYRRARAPSFSRYGDRRLYAYGARSALQQARYALEAQARAIVWDRHDGFTIGDGDRHIDDAPGTSLDCPGAVRLRLVPDDCMSFDDLAGDTYTAELHPEIPRSVMDRERQAYIDKINAEGVWGVVGEYWNGLEWEHADSCFGFVGDDWRGSGYDQDIMSATLSALGDHQANQARDLEAARPDMYGRPSC
jgi:hypothetical protein